MILVQREPFRVSSFHHRCDPEMAVTRLARGPVIQVKLRFERWLMGKPLDADAFVDPGADETILSLRWILEQGGWGRHSRPRSTTPDPQDPAHCLLREAAYVQIGGRELALNAGRPVRLMLQPPMAGFEDVLLGRDFLVAHGLLVLLDALEGSLSILDPADEDNQRRRGLVHEAMSEPPVAR